MSFKREVHLNIKSIFKCVSLFFRHLFNLKFPSCSQLSERERSAANRIEIARGEVAMEWENRLMEEMTRLKMELEQVHIDERNVALNELKAEHLLESQTLATKFKQREETFNEQV